MRLCGGLPIKNVLTAFLFAIICVIGNAPHAPAQIFADSVCDPDYYQSLRSRAWLEAQREITQNQNLIFKSDSVLEYTCFDSFLNHFADATINRPMFSMSDRWVAAGGPAGDIEASLTPVAAQASIYEGLNFNHPLLGGRATGAATINGAVVAGAYGCNVMAQVWQTAKCMNFMDDPEDGFFTFQEYATNPDVRRLPAPCNAPVDYVIPLEETVSANDILWVRDVVTPDLDIIFPPGGGCGGAASMINTGLEVLRSDANPNRYNEHICLVPGCHYVPAGLNTGTCSGTVQP